jgi:hypothetical protein
MSKEDKESLEDLFQRQIEIYRATNKEAEDLYKAEMAVLKDKIRELNKQIYSIVEQQKEVSNKYGFPFTLDRYCTWIPAKFFNKFEPLVKENTPNGPVLNYERLDVLCDNFEINYNVLDSSFYAVNFTVGVVGWEPSSC